MSSFGNSAAKKEYRPLDSHYREVEDLSYALSLRLASSVGDALLKQDGSQPKASPTKSSPSKKLDEPDDSQDSPDSNATKEGDDPVEAHYQKYYDEVSSIIKANNALLDTIGGCLSEIASFHGLDEELDNMHNDAYEAWADSLDSTAKKDDDGPAEVPSRDAQGPDEDDDGSLFSLFNDTPPEENEELDDADEVAQLLSNISTMEEDGGPAEATSTSQEPQELDKRDDGPLFSLLNEASLNNDKNLGEGPDTSSSNTTTDEDDDSVETEILYQKDNPADQEKFSRIIHALIDCQLSKTGANSQRRQVPPANNLEEDMREEEALILESMAGPDATAAEKKKIADEAGEVRQRLAAQSIESIPEGVARARAAWRASPARAALLKRRERERLRAQALSFKAEGERAARVEAGERIAMEIWSRALGMDLYGTPYFEPALEGFKRIAEMGEKAFAELEDRLLFGGEGPCPDGGSGNGCAPSSTGVSLRRCGRRLV
ncbi:hypothetical protein SLS53_005204 [Cytospora paraplurivora]|uniref:Uncharacterized protein n=1 Tax=Cytospora paraplurivora TaxID=2898453 RepID=A0AAN9U850_9PEZI